MEKLSIQAPVVQVAIDVLTIDDALRIAEAAVKAGVDWLEVGTPLVTFAGTAAIGALAREFPGVPVLADYKMMDGVRKYVIEAASQGGRLATICAVASDASLREAIAAGRDAGITMITDLYASHDVAARAVEVEGLGIDSVYVHWGADQRREKPEHDPLTHLTEVIARVKIPVGVGTFSVADQRREKPEHDPLTHLIEVIERVKIPVGVGTFSVADGVRAFQLGASIAVIGVPLIQAADVEGALREYVEQAKAAWKGNH